MSYHRLTQSGCPPELLRFGVSSMVTPISSNDDMIAVPRSVLAAAAHCVRRYAGTDSETYKHLSEYSISPAPATFAGQRLSDLQAGNWHPYDES